MEEAKFYSVHTFADRLPILRCYLIEYILYLDVFVVTYKPYSMKLQQSLIQKIDDYIGIEDLSKEMERYRSLTHEKKWFNYMIIYFNCLYHQNENVEEHAISYRQIILGTKAFLDEFNETRNEATIQFLLDLIQFKLDYVEGMSRIP